MLPVSNDSFEKSKKERCLFLSDALTTQSSKDLSPFAAQIVIISLCGSKLAELQRYDPTATPVDSAGSIWLLLLARSLFIEQLELNLAKTLSPSLFCLKVRSDV